MTDEICAFCLGGSSEIPPFGTAKDAEDIILPCSTCSLVAHRKCLLDWFNSIPALKLTRSHEHTLVSYDSETDTENEPNLINVTFQLPWMSAAGLFVRDPDYHVHAANSDIRLVMLLTSCPQCKSKITFCMRKLAFLGLNSLVRALVSDLVQYSGVFLGVSGAATGIVTMGYVGLARCGINMLDALVPLLLLFPLLAKKNAKNLAASLLLMGPEKLEKTLSVMDHLAFQHIPLLPVMMYRMRQSLILACFFNNSARSALANWGGELLVCNYISSLGHHTLVRQLYGNLKKLVLKIAQNPQNLKSYRFLKLFAGVNWWDPNVMVGALIPARWIYEILFRLTFNRFHFSLAAKIRPRDIANSLSEHEMARLEDLDNSVGRLHIETRDRARKAAKLANGKYILSKLKLLQLLLKDDIIPRYLKSRFLLFLHKSRACLRRDYSTTLLYSLAIITGVTTVVWPFLASDFGKIMYKLVLLRVLAFDGVDKDKVIFLLNIIGMGMVAIAKDIYNLVMCSRKAKQLSDMAIVYTDQSAPAVPLPTAGFPGSFTDS